jgi:hypothetical protein
MAMDTVLFGQRLERPDTDVSMKLEFRKARERTPATRADFEEISVALVNDEWTYSSPEGGNKTKPSPLGLKFLDALLNALASDGVTISGGTRRAHHDAWKRECLALGLIDRDKDHSARTLFAKHRRELISHNLIACSEDFAWTIEHGCADPFATIPQPWLRNRPQPSRNYAATIGNIGPQPSATIPGP